MVMPRWTEIYDLMKRGATLEAQRRIVELQGSYIELQEENVKLREQIAELTKRLKDASAIIWKEPFYFREMNGSRDGPLCQVCFDNKAKEIRLQKYKLPTHVRYNCPVCLGTWIGKGELKV